MGKNQNPWKWLPSLYFAEGIPYVLVMTLSVIFYKRMGISNSDIALYTSWLYLPWVIKPLWSPIVDMLKTKRFWIVIMQLCIGVGLSGVAFTIPVDSFFQYTLAFFWLLAFSSATHDIAADGFYMIGLNKHQQTFFVGIRSTFYRLAMLTGQGLLVILAGYVESRTGLPQLEVNVSAVKTTQSEFIAFDPSGIEVHSEEGDMHFITSERIDVPIKSLAKSDVFDQLREVESWNASHGFYSLEANNKSQVEAGWFSRNVSSPLRSTIKDLLNLSEGGNTITTTGNIGFTWFYLNEKPESGEKVVLNFSYEKGDKNIQLARDYRYEFTDKNWNIPAIAVFRLDPKLSQPVATTFSGLSGNIRFAWTVVFFSISILFFAFFLYHRLFLPKPEEDTPTEVSEKGFVKEFIDVFVLFFKKKQIGVILTFLLVYRLGESQLVKLASPFLLDSREIKGLGLTTGDIGLIYGTIGIIFLTLGGILGGVVASRRGLKYWLWWMVAAMNLPNLVYVYLSFALPDSLWVVSVSVAIEQFGYGFGFTAYMLYMIYVSEGPNKTAHFAITTGFMALGMMIPGMISGWLQEIIGYDNFFIWVMICTIPSFIIIRFLKVDSEFGKDQ